MGNPANIPKLSALESRRFCRDGDIPSGMITKALKDSLFLVNLYESNCPCGENDPPWVVTARHLSMLKKGRPFFPNLFRQHGIRQYDAAMEALIKYKRVKPFYKTWAALWKAASEASIGLDQKGLEVVVNLSDSGWKGFMTQLTDEVVGTLKGKIESAIHEKVESELSEVGRLRFQAGLAYLERIGMLHEIWKGIQAKKLANKPADDPDVFDYKLRFFIGLMAKGPKYHRLYKRYWAYDKAHWELMNFVDREKALGSKNKDSHRVWKPRGKRMSLTPLPADSGLGS